MGPKMDRLARKFAQLVESPKNFAEYTARLSADKYAGVSTSGKSGREREAPKTHAFASRNTNLESILDIIDISIYSAC